MSVKSLFGVNENFLGPAIGAEQWDVFETTFISAKKYDNPFLDVQVDVVFRRGDQHWLVPAFWAGGDTWTVRFAPPAQGEGIQCDSDYLRTLPG